MSVGFFFLPSGRSWHAVASAVVAACGIAAILYAIRRYRPQQPSTWYTFAAGLALWLLNNAMDRVTSAEPWSTISGVLAVAGYPPLCWAIMGLVRGRARAADRTGLIDAGIVATSLALPYWIFVVGPALADGAVPILDRVETLLYSAGDVVMFALCSLLVTTPGARTPSYRMLIGALLTSMASDILFVVAPAPPSATRAADIAIVVSNAFVAGAALHPSMRRLTVPLARPPAFVRPRLALLVGAILLSPAVSLYVGATGRIADNWLATGIGCVVLFLLVATRLAGLVRRVESQARRLAQLAYEDPLTGLANRREWDKRLAVAMAESVATGESLLVGIIDLDHFKRYNDTYGHQSGDELLAEAAAVWRAALRDEDLLARYGGEEFALLLTGRTAGEAVRVMERMLAATPRGQTFSGGVVCWDGRQSAEDLVHRADELLYASKGAGRARVTGPEEALSPAGRGGSVHGS